MRTVHLSISGRVQGVGFRLWLAEAARGHDLDGWVRNRRDGTVEAVVGGAPGPLDALIDECWRGPAGADVRGVAVGEWNEEPQAGFPVLPTE